MATGLQAYQIPQPKSDYELMQEQYDAMHAPKVPEYLAPNGQETGSQDLYSVFQRNLPGLQAATKPYDMNSALAEYQKNMDDLRKLRLQSRSQQTKGIKDLESQIAAYTEPRSVSQTVDFSPLAAYADSLTGGNITRGIKAPKTNDERLREGINLREALQQRKENLTESDIKNLQAQTQDKLALTQLQQSQSQKQPTAEQFKAAGFAARLNQAENVFSELAGQGYSRGTRGEQINSLLPGEWQGENFKRQDQAERNFINAVLRRESGAVISPEEFKNAELQYFPRPGDTPTVLAQKKDNRDQVRMTLTAEGSNALVKIPQVSAQPHTQQAPAGWVQKDGYWVKE